LSQEAVAQRGELRREQVSDVERGKNQATSARILNGLANGAGIALETMAQVLDGVISPEKALACARPDDRGFDRGREAAISEEPMDPKWQALADLIEIDGEPAEKAYALIRAVEQTVGLVTAADFYHAARKKLPRFSEISNDSARSLVDELTHNQRQNNAGDGARPRKKRD
jgi:transcriptional regulator with XRE-family HTH domain